MAPRRGAGGRFVGSKSTGTGLRFFAEKPETQAAIRALVVSNQEKIKLVAESVGLETVAYLRSLTTEMRPPARMPGGNVSGPRRAHPGHWADVTSQLALSYWYEVKATDSGVVLSIGNSAEYAIWLELKHGFFVVKGVAEPNGPVAQALARIVPQVAPGWQVRLS